MNEVVAVAADEGLGGVTAFGRAIHRSGRVPVLLTGAAGSNDSATDLYERVTTLEDPYDPTALMEAATRAADGRRLVGLFSCYDGLVVPAAQAAAALALPHPALGGLLRARNKHSCREACRRAGLATPLFGLVSSEADCACAADSVGFPAVLKPLNGLASHLVRRVEGPEELTARLRELRERIGDSFSGNYGRPVADGDETALDPRSTFLVERFLDGPEFSAELVVRGGVPRRVALFRKLLVEEPGFLECGFAWPAFADGDGRAEALWSHIEQCVATLGVDDCAAHVELIETKQGPVLVEANAGRAGGQILVRAVREAVGVDLIEEILALQTGEPAPPPRLPTLTGPVTTLTLFPCESGRLEGIDGLQATAALPGVVEVVTFCGPGDELDVRDKEFFAVNLLVAGVEPEAIRGLYERARELVRFRIVPRGGAVAVRDPTLPEARVLADPRRRAAIEARGRLLAWLRGFLSDHGFLEVQTPFLHAAPEAAHVVQLELSSPEGRSLYLRTDPEEYLKRYLTAGFDAVYEISANVRDEPPDTIRLREFTSVECYRRGWCFAEALDLCSELVAGALLELRGDTRTALLGRAVDLGLPLNLRRFDDLLLEHTGLDVRLLKSPEKLAAAVRERGWWQGTGTELDGFRRTWLEWLLDNRVLDRLGRPTFVVDFPVELGMSARERLSEPGVCLRAELYLPGGFEVAHVYENLVEPDRLRERYEERIRHRVAAGLSSVPLDEGLLASAALGMPPMAGLAVGVDRLLLLALGEGVVGDGLLFPREGWSAD